MQHFRVLSLDGGGSWAMVQVVALAKLYDEHTLGHTVLRDFDLVAATSGGAIVLGSLIKNLTLGDILNRYFLIEAERRKIFAPMHFWGDWGHKAAHLIGAGAIYNTKDKLEGLKQIFGSVDRPLPDLRGEIVAKEGRCPHFLITAFDYDRLRATFFRSNGSSSAANGSPAALPTLAEAIHATSTAPVKYFDDPAEVKGRRYWDGGVTGYNNPVLAAVTETLANAKPGTYSAADVRVLSIGTGSVRLPVNSTFPAADNVLVQVPDEPSFETDLSKLAASILDDPPDAATFISHVVLGQLLPSAGGVSNTGTVVRMSPMVQPEFNAAAQRWDRPPGLNGQEFKALSKMDMDAVEDSQANLVLKLAQAWVQDMVPNQPIRSNSDTFACEIGDERFSGALAHWKRIF